MSWEESNKELDRIKEKMRKIKSEFDKNIETQINYNRKLREVINREIKYEAHNLAREDIKQVSRGIQKLKLDN